MVFFFGTLLRFILLLRFPPGQSVADVTTIRYGEDALAIFRSLERLKIKHGKLVCDLQFLRECRDAELVPVFLRYKLSSARLRNSSEVSRSRQRLLTNEINSKERALQRLREGIDTYDSRLRSRVRHIDYVYYSRLIDDRLTFHKDSWTATHCRKLLNLRAHMRSTNVRLDPDQVVSNFSSYVLSETEMFALCRGLDFSLPPPKLRKGNYLSNYELLYGSLVSKTFVGNSEDKLYFNKKLSDIAFTSLYNFNYFRHSMSNLSNEEYKALKALSRNKDIIVTRPDKGSGVVILDRSDYIKKVELILEDKSKFDLAKNQDIFKISRTIETRVRNFLRDKVYKKKLISEEVYKSLYPNGSHIGILYGLPKCHKSGVPVRPICSAVGTSTYDLGKFVANIIKPAAVNKYGTDLDNTFQFVDQIKEQNLTDHVMVSFDVCSLFTNIPLSKTIDVCLDRLYRGPDPSIKPTLPEDVLKRLIELCVKDNTFVFNGKVYVQKDGVAMGSSLGPLLANIWMAHLEETLMQGHAEFPLFYRRYVDDTFCLFKDRFSADMFFIYLNSIDNNIKFEIEWEQNDKLEFLDTVVMRSYASNFPDIRTKVKVTDKGLFYHFSSFVPMKYKLNLVSTLVYRIYKIASTYQLFHQDLEILKKKLVSNGFPLHFIETSIANVLNKFYTDTKQEEKDESGENVVMVLPYMGHISYSTKRKIMKLVSKFYPSVKLKIVFTRGYRLSNMFAYKDKLPLSCRSCVVYYTQCEKCGPSAAYVGKTKNTLHERFYSSSGHLHPSSNNSALLGHFDRTGDPECEFVFNNIKILDSAKYDYKLRFVESIILKYEKQNLNTQERSIPLNVV